jgi:tRNA(fMet)-specific endonuclease VapC
MLYLMDSNACIGWMRQHEPKLVARIKREPSRNIVICSVVLGELFYGVERSGAAYRANNFLLVEQLRIRFASVPFDDSAAGEYGIVRAHLTNLGQLIGANDMLIAAIALTNGLTLVTHNTTEFRRVPQLLLEDWQ